MIRHITRISLAALFVLATFSQLAAQVDIDDKHRVGARFILPNYATLLKDIPSNFLGKDNFGAGLAFEYQRKFAPNFSFAIPLSLSVADAIKDENVNLTAPVNLSNEVRSLAEISLGGLLVFEPIARRSVFDPQLFAGIGVRTEDFLANTLEVPLGLNLNFNFGQGFTISPQIAYHLALDQDAGDIRNKLQLGLGVLFGGSKDNVKVPEPPKVVDTDGDGIEDAADQCPTEAGPIALLGCPDKDGDGIADKNDKCPDVAGLATLMGCPDTDGDGITDAEDKCPTQAGPASNQGCPITDRDGDGVPDAEDKCPDVAGTLALMGCPDNDGDGVANANDRCPDQPGTAANKGCPDTDNDTVVDPDDRCPTEFGTVGNKGCPEIAKEDQETINFAIQNINFETGSSVIRADSRETLAKVIDIMNRYPAYSLAIGGHTDSIGSAESNMSLSERRAESVMKYLIDNGIKASRMTSKGYGETLPIADNRYKDGREQNRRVTLDLSVE